MDENIYDAISRRTKDATNQQEAAKALGVSETLYSLIINRKRDVSARLAKELGYRVRTVKIYERIQPAPEPPVNSANDAASIKAWHALKGEA